MRRYSTPYLTSNADAAKDRLGLYSNCSRAETVTAYDGGDYVSPAHTSKVTRSGL